MGKGQATASSSKGKGKAKSSVSGPIKGKVESLLGNGKALSASVFLGYGNVNLVHHLQPSSEQHGQDLDLKLQWASWNSREAPSDDV